MRSFRSAALLTIVAAAPAGAQILGASRLLSNRNGENRQWQGVGRLTRGSTCTGFLIKTQGGPDARAYLVSNGHCVSTTSPNEVIRELPDTRRAAVFHYFHDTTDRQLRVATTQVAYSTMKGVDVSILELSATLGELASAGIEPLETSQTAGEPGEEVVVVGAPTSGIPSDETFLRRAQCRLGEAQDLVEFIWHFRRAYRNDCSDIRGGSSGSPVISLRTGKVVAVMNTTTAGAVHETGDFLCYNGQPCEIAATDGGGPSFRYLKDTNYAIAIHGLAGCFNIGGRFDVALAACPLDAGRQLSVTQNTYSTQPFRTLPDGARVRATWDATLSGDLAYYRYKIIAEGRDDCRRDQGYGSVRRLTDANRIDDPVPETPGRYYLCVLGGDSPAVDTAWQKPDFATKRVKRVDTTPPTIPIPYLWQDGPEQWTLEPVFVVPELTNYRYKIAAVENDSCADPAGYRTYLRVPVRIPKADSRHRVCLIGEDLAGNATTPAEFPLHGLRVHGVVNGASFRSGAAPNTWISIFGVNFPESASGVTVTLIDSAGAARPLDVWLATRSQINTYIPADTATGPARLAIRGPDGTAETGLMIDQSAPGVFTPRWIGLGAPLADAFRVRADGTQEYQRVYSCVTSVCFPEPLDMPVESDHLRLIFYTTGISGSSSSVRVELGGVPVEASLNGSPGAAVTTITVRVTASFPLRGFLPLTVIAGGRTSNTTTVRLRVR